MQKTLELGKAIKINGGLRKELKYDTEEITGDHFIEADARARDKAAHMGKVSFAVAETDQSLQLYLGMMAILAVEHDVDITDLERIKGHDVMKIYQIGRNFTKGSAEEEEKEASQDLEENNSEEPTEPTPDSITAISAD